MTRSNLTGRTGRGLQLSGLIRLIPETGNMAEKELIISKTEIAKRIKELGDAITNDYGNNRLLVVGILKGAFIFLADLVREIRLDMEIDFVRLASYGLETTAGSLSFTKDIELEVRGRAILLVEDIIDTGRTLSHLKHSFENRGAQSVRLCVLIDKRERRAVDVAVDYAGFVVQQGFLVGYGLDYSERHRQLPGTRPTSSIASAATRPISAVKTRPSRLSAPTS